VGLDIAEGKKREKKKGRINLFTISHEKGGKIPCEFTARGKLRKAISKTGKEKRDIQLSENFSGGGGKKKEGEFPLV